MFSNGFEFAKRKILPVFILSAIGNWLKNISNLDETWTPKEFVNIVTENLQIFSQIIRKYLLSFLTNSDDGCLQNWIIKRLNTSSGNNHHLKWLAVPLMVVSFKLQIQTGKHSSKEELLFHVYFFCISEEIFTKSSPKGFSLCFLGKNCILWPCLTQ